MAGILDSVDQRTNLVGENRLELLMFRLYGPQTFAINVFKIQEVIKLPGLTAMPHRHPVVCGVTNLRGKTVPVINLSMAIHMRALTPDKDSTIIVTEYNRSVQAFLVGSVDRIINLNWSDILPPPKGAGRNHYLTAITKFKNEIVEIIDVEKVLAEIITYNTDVPVHLVDKTVVEKVNHRKILLVDDSPVARSQAMDTLRKIGFEVITANNGLEALRLLKSIADRGEPVQNELLMVITDAEMPEMDGYRLTTEIRQDARLKSMFVVLHTSLSGSFNVAMTEKVGCDRFLSKFRPEELAITVQDYARSID